MKAALVLLLLVCLASAVAREFQSLQVLLSHGENNDRISNG